MRVGQGQKPPFLPVPARFQDQMACQPKLHRYRVYPISAAITLKSAGARLEWSEAVAVRRTEIVEPEPFSGTCGRPQGRLGFGERERGTSHVGKLGSGQEPLTETHIIENRVRQRPGVEELVR